MMHCGNRSFDRQSSDTGLPLKEVTMLYQFHELNRTMLNPLIQWAEASSKLFTNPGAFAVRTAHGGRLRIAVSPW
jgi:hypothetical protein